MKPTIRVTELQTWLECKYRHALNYREHLSRIPGSEGGVSPQVSGSAIHFGIEAAMLEHTGRNKVQVAQESAMLYLRARGADERYAHGVETALRGVPAEVWQTVTPQSEQRINVEYDKYIMSGQPDLWTYDENAIIITDFKSTSKDEGDRLSRYQLLNMQPRWYAVLLTAHMRAQKREIPPIYTRHIILSTRGKPVVGAPVLQTEAGLMQAGRMMHSIASDIAMSEAVSFQDATVSSSCDWCEFLDLCTMHLTGGDWHAIMAEKYRRETSIGIS